MTPPHASPPTPQPGTSPRSSYPHLKLILRHSRHPRMSFSLRHMPSRRNTKRTPRTKSVGQPAAQHRSRAIFPHPFQEYNQPQLNLMNTENDFRLHSKQKKISKKKKSLRLYKSAQPEPPREPQRGHVKPQRRLQLAFNPRAASARPSAKNSKSFCRVYCQTPKPANPLRHPISDDLHGDPDPIDGSHHCERGLFALWAKPAI